MPFMARGYWQIPIRQGCWRRLCGFGDTQQQMIKRYLTIDLYTWRQSRNSITSALHLLSSSRHITSSHASMLTGSHNYSGLPCRFDCKGLVRYPINAGRRVLICAFRRLLPADLPVRPMKWKETTVSWHRLAPIDTPSSPTHCI